MSDVIPRLCECDPPITAEWRDGASVVFACPTCGASAVSLSAGMPAFVRDVTRYQVSVDLTTRLLTSFVGLIKQKTGLTTPQLLALARDQARVTLIADQAITVHYALREFAAAGLPVQVEPPYPHDFRSDR